MHIIKISDDSYKVILSKDDLSKYGDEVFDGSDSSKHFFTDILHLVSQSTDVHKGSCVAHAEFFEDKFGGGELFICLHSTSTENCGRALRSKSIEHIIGACKMIDSLGLAVSSKLYYYNESYVLIVFSHDSIQRITNRLNEYGKSTSVTDLLLWQLDEHSRVLIETDAVERVCCTFT